MNRFRPSSLPAILGTLLVVSFGTPLVAQEKEAKPRLEIRDGDHICIIGNTLAERMQHDGWLETYIHARFPEKKLVIRNLGFAADEVTVRPRSASFGSPDSWLAHCQADVIFAFFGYNESFQGQAGIEKFKNDVDKFVKQTLAQKYNGKGGPRLVLFSPIAHENLNDRNLPDGKENNRRIELYTDALAEVAKTNHVVFVDLFRSTRAFYAAAGVSARRTVNGVHLNEFGNEIVASIIDTMLFGEATPGEPGRTLNKLRQAVLDVNHHWFNRYRTVDGYSIYGGRADLKFTDGQTNRVVMSREMEILDQMTANRDKVVWAIAQAKDAKVDDSNLPPFIPVITNKPGPLPGGKHVFLSGEDEISKMTLGKGMKVNLFASEKEFPELTNAVQMSWDTKGRLWVAVWPSYPHWKPSPPTPLPGGEGTGVRGEPMNDKLLILEDTKGTGKADKCTVFADGLHCPTGFEFWNGGVIVAQVPDLVFLKDSKGGDKADIRRRILDGLDSADTHHSANSFVLDPGGALYFQEGTFHHTGVETPWGPPVRNFNAGVYRYEPRSQKFEVYINFGFANPHGHVFDRWGQDIVIDGTGAQPYHAALFSGFLPFPQRHKTPPQVYKQNTRPCPGMEILSSRHFPDDMQGNLLVANVIGFQGILRVKLEDKGGSFIGTHMEPILSSTDPKFRPSDLRIGPDGALYFLDWHNPIIGHMQHNIRDPNRDREHGRIYRVTYEGRDLLTPPKIAGESIEKLLNLLESPEDRVRYRARIELGGRDSDQVIAAARTRWAGLLEQTNDSNLEHHKLELLWLHQNHNVVNVEMLKGVLRSPDFHARAAATRVLCYWRDRVPDALELLKKQAGDDNPCVRLEAVRAASFFKEAEAVEVVLIAMDQPMSEYLEFVRGETMRTLDPYVQKAVKDGRALRFTSPAGDKYLAKIVSTADLLKMKGTQSIYHELVLRKGLRDDERLKAVGELAKLEQKSVWPVLIESIQALDRQDAPDDSVMFDLFRLLASPREEANNDLSKAVLADLATSAKTPLTRQLGFVALVAADKSVERAWKLAHKSPGGLADLLTAMPLISDPGRRADLYPMVLPLLKNVSAAPSTDKDKPIVGRFVRVELPGEKRTLTLAEVEVYSAGKNIARKGKASQISTYQKAAAGKAIDGITSGKYKDGGMTHTEEDIANPWWEVDLGGEYPLESIVIFNRTEAKLGKRLEGFTLKVLDAGRHVTFEKKDQPAPNEKVAFELGKASEDEAVPRAAMLALTSVRGQEETTFKELARFVKAGEHGSLRDTAVQAIQRIPPTYWPKGEVQPLLDRLLAHVRQIPDKERTGPAALNALQLADALANTLPLKEARVIRAELGELGVRVLRIGTLPEQMLFDKERIAVKAGKAVEIVFENTDLMPHNLVITEPGALEEIGLMAESTGTQPGAAERNYVPVSKKVLFSSRLLAPRESQRISFTAPTTPGVYPIVCTYPGHSRRMFGAMYVVADLEEYQADPTAYLSRHPLPIADELLKLNRPRKDWQFDELAPLVSKLDRGRSFASAKQMFQVANCVACHKLNGVGTEIGPDLAKLDPGQKSLDILKKILEPSSRINEKFQSYVLELNSGKIVTGLIVEETPQLVKVIENPLASKQPTILKTADIAERRKSPTSIMPKGQVDRLTQEEILDLVAYILARGDERHAVFQAGMEHGHKGH